MKMSVLTILQGVEFPIFLLILAWALQQCSANALPVIKKLNLMKPEPGLGTFYDIQPGIRSGLFCSSWGLSKLNLDEQPITTTCISVLITAQCQVLS